MSTSDRQEESVIQFRNSRAEKDWDDWVVRNKDNSDPTVRDTVIFGKNFVDIAEARIGAGVPLADCWSDVVALAGAGMSLSGDVIIGTLRTVAVAWTYGDELARTLSLR